MEPFPTLSPYTFGSMSIGGVPEDFREHIRIARAVMDAGIWVHSSQGYAGGGTFMILRHAFDEDRAHVPKLVLKIRCEHAAMLKFFVEDALRRLGIERIEVAQLFMMTPKQHVLMDDFLARGEMWQVCQDFLKQGKVGHFVMETFMGWAPDVVRAVMADLFPGYIVYFSAGEREASKELFDLWEEKKTPVLSLRTMWGGLLDPARIEALRVKEPLNPAIGRFDALKPIYERSGCGSWAEFSFSFLRSFPNLRTSIAGTSRMENLKALLEADRAAKPLRAELAARIRALQDSWETKT